MSIFAKMEKKNLIENKESFLTDENVVYEVITGSIAYGCNLSSSDIDIYGVIVPTKDIIFPHTAGYIYEFDKTYPKFDQILISNDIGSGVIYDTTYYNIVKYFRLCLECNPNMIDTLYIDDIHVTKKTDISNHMRLNRHLFLHKGLYDKFKGYATSQFNKTQKHYVMEFIKLCERHNLPLDVKMEELNGYVIDDGDKDILKYIIQKLDMNVNRGGRIETVAKHGYDLKAAMHAIRLLDEGTQLLRDNDMILKKKSDLYKDIRVGKYSFEEITYICRDLEEGLQAAYTGSTLPKQPNVKAVRELLYQCLEMHFGTLSNVIVSMSRQEKIVAEIKDVLSRY